MTVMSMRTAMSEIGVTGTVRLPGDLASFPRSIRDIGRAAASPKPDLWKQASEDFLDEGWTEECQGVTHDGSRFYFSANGHIKPGSAQAVQRYLGNGEVSTLIDLDDEYGGHLGDIDHYDGIVFAAMEQPARVLEIEMNGSVRRRSPLTGADGGKPPQSDLSWCAINPWNGLLYSSPFDPAGTVFAYDPSDGYRHRPAASITLARTAHRVQGGVFSPRGHLYLACDTHADDPRYKVISVYSALNGHHYGTIEVLAQESADGDADQELEGLCLAAGTWHGKPAQLHVILLENRTIAADNVFFKHFSAPSPDLV